MPQASMRIKVALIVIFIIAIAAFVVWQMTSTKAPEAAVPSGGTSAPLESLNPGATQPSGSGGTPSNTTAFKDGSYTGDAVDAFYGIVQVKAVISGGKIVDVQFLKYPNDRGHTIEVSQQVMPILKQEAITVQSSHVDSISGATQTVDGFKASLESALAQAKA